MPRDKEALAHLKEVAERTPWAQLLGIKVQSLDQGRAELVVNPAEWHFDPGGRLERVVAFAVMDLAMELASQSMGRQGVILEERLSFIKALAEPQPVVAVARVVASSRRKSSLEVQLVSKQGPLVAKASASCYYV